MARGVVLTVLAQQIQRVLWQMRCLGDQSAADVCSMVFAVVIHTIPSELIRKRQGFSQNMKNLDLKKVFQKDLDGVVKLQKRLALATELDVKQLVKHCVCIVNPKDLADKWRGL